MWPLCCSWQGPATAAGPPSLTPMGFATPANPFMRSLHLQHWLLNPHYCRLNDYYYACERMHGPEKTRLVAASMRGAVRWVQALTQEVRCEGRHMFRMLLRLHAARCATSLCYCLLLLLIGGRQQLKLEVGCSQLATLEHCRALPAVCCACRRGSSAGSSSWMASSCPTALQSAALAPRPTPCAPTPRSRWAWSWRHPYGGAA